MAQSAKFARTVKVPARMKCSGPGEPSDASVTAVAGSELSAVTLACNFLGRDELDHPVKRETGI